ncbi:MAG TPA: uridine diphosphate-N-acetylglucosamine-binding protein YvcK [Acidimicrobiia bacterium]
MTEPPSPTTGPSVVALGGGHGLSVALRATQRYAGRLTAVVSVADDGGSSGRLRRDLDVVPPGDLRKCLVAVAAPGNPWAEAFEHRFGGTELAGHALGNLVLVGLAETLGDLGTALEEAARLLGASARIRPATTEHVVLKAQVDSDGVAPEEVRGQVAVMHHHGRIRRIELVPNDAAADPVAVDAIRDADQIVLAPGSLFTSLLPVLVVPEIRRAVAEARAQVVQVGNLAPQIPETEGLDGVDHLRAVLDHGARVDMLLVPPAETARLAVDDVAVHQCGVRAIRADVAEPGAHGHDPARLAQALDDLLDS